jgi:hypothetical protein
MADPKVSTKGRLLTLAIFGGLFVIAVLLMWYYWTNIRGVDPTASLPTSGEVLTSPIVFSQL